jgi:hypothetical protein
MFQRDRTFTQDFYQLRRQCLVKGKLFEDPQFPAVRESIFFSGGGPKQKIEWKRPHVRDVSRLFLMTTRSLISMQE